MKRRRQKKVRKSKGTEEDKEEVTEGKQDRGGDLWRARGRDTGQRGGDGGWENNLDISQMK
ncbi:hypothetical protein EYF80_024049 [Liparis tanakae]|uniref:Uncharacterized protein n=1 Tax=Liparis tanakae TaxID=230148 RepID=A0A4Z2HIX2_9TELE|nr:hypothetical protein EYF80_024049 [Liparis tanakae]